MTGIILENVSKSFGDVRAVEGVTLEINDGEFVVLVGPSGCGKTTLLELVLGALKPDKGHIYIDGEMIDNMPIAERNMGFVPQDFGLFPHLNVWDNVVYGLRIRRYPNQAILIMGGEILEMLELEDLRERYPSQLSWGQRQRTALARALVIEPRLLLLDEPLSSVDWIARQEIAQGIKKLQSKLKITTIYVTHDIGEALKLAQRAAIMNRGKLEQYDTPKNLIRKPDTDFVSQFISGSMA